MRQTADHVAGNAERDGIAAAQARPAPLGAREAALLRLQGQAGNRAVASLVQRMGAEPSAAECFLALPADLDALPAGLDQEVAGPAGAQVAATAASGIAGAAPVSWAALNGADREDGAAAILGPGIATLAAITAANGGNTGGIGWTSFPLATAKAPQFDMGAVASTPGGMGPPSWACTPTWKQHYDEGTNVCMFLDAGRHPTTLLSGGKPVFFQLSAAMSALDGQAEGEHANDIKQARDISIKEAETVLNDHIIGKTLASAGSKAEAEQKVLDEITTKLTHAGLGNDQTKWAAIYETLYRKTLQRDNKLWHTFGVTARTVNAAGEVTLEVGPGSTSINTMASAALIVY